MITPDYLQTMSRYNSWQNKSLYGASDTLDDKERRQDRGAFFGSIHSTLAHLLWGDQLWLSRFAGTPEPIVASIKESSDMISEWKDLKKERFATDRAIETWAKNLAPEELVGDLEWYSGALKKTVKKPKAMLVVHFFNHQTHHRGQVHAMITAAGGKTDDTDLFVMG